MARTAAHITEASEATAKIGYLPGNFRAGDNNTVSEVNFRSPGAVISIAIKDIGIYQITPL